ncbi:MAG: hypothetical protein IPM38_03600 [Ignavibacteria bacterium]|nr:hypothetical protein [Ignavibacteria bacterium]
MIKILFAVFFISVSLDSKAQDLFIPGNPYDNAPETTRDRNSFNRERWFYEQRMYPDNKLPDNAYSNSLKQRDLLRQSQGYLFDGKKYVGKHRSYFRYLFHIRKYFITNYNSKI